MKQKLFINVLKNEMYGNKWQRKKRNVSVQEKEIDQSMSTVV